MSKMNDNTLSQLDALNNWLGDVFDKQTNFNTLLMDAGFSEAGIEQIKQTHLSEFLQAVLDLLDNYKDRPGDQRHMVMVWHYGLIDGIQQDFYEIGYRAGVSGERIRQLVNRRLSFYHDPQQQVKFREDFAVIGRRLLD